MIRVFAIDLPSVELAILFSELFENRSGVRQTGRYGARFVVSVYDESFALTDRLLNAGFAEYPLTDTWDIACGRVPPLSDG